MARKRRIALLLWHPDKFHALCGRHLSAGDRGRIEGEAAAVAQRVMEVSQADLWGRREERAAAHAFPHGRVIRAVIGAVIAADLGSSCPER